MEATGFPPLAEFGGEVNMSAGQWQYVVGSYVNTTLGEEWPGSQIALIEGFAAGAQTRQRLVSYKSGPWHGEFSFTRDPYMLDVAFDCKARNDRLKTTRLHKDPGLQEHEYTGHDYRGRVCMVTWQKAYLYNAGTWAVLWEAPRTLGPPPALQQ